MIDSIFRNRASWPFSPSLYQIALDTYALAEFWEPEPSRGFERGRTFEQLLHRYCEFRRFWLSERTGGRTLRGHRAASGLQHELDAVIALPGSTIHFELKYLQERLTKNELLIFNQKGLDFLFADYPDLRHKPLYRVLLSGNELSPAARRFAAQWGILVIEPGRIPLLLLHWLSGAHVEGLSEVEVATIEKVWCEIPRFVVPLQERVQHLSRLLDGGGEVISSHRIDILLNHLQVRVGEAYGRWLDTHHPGWLEAQYDDLQRALGLTARKPIMFPETIGPV